MAKTVAPVKPLSLALGGYNTTITRNADGSITIVVAMFLGHVSFTIPAATWAKIVAYAGGRG